MPIVLLILGILLCIYLLLLLPIVVTADLDGEPEVFVKWLCFKFQLYPKKQKKKKPKKNKSVKDVQKADVKKKNNNKKVRETTEKSRFSVLSSNKPYNLLPLADEVVSRTYTA